MALQRSDGELALEQLLLMVGETILDVDALTNLLIHKGVFTVDEWQAARDESVVERGIVTDAALRQVRDVKALKSFFGVVDKEDDAQSEVDPDVTP